jgi:hypothetical protein
VDANVKQGMGAAVISSNEYDNLFCPLCGARMKETCRNLMNGSWYMWLRCSHGNCESQMCIKLSNLTLNNISYSARMEPQMVG